MVDNAGGECSSGAGRSAKQQEVQKQWSRKKCEAARNEAAVVQEEAQSSGQVRLVMVL
jgi:hypothetical protein